MGINCQRQFILRTAASPFIFGIMRLMDIVNHDMSALNDATAEHMNAVFAEFSSLNIKAEEDPESGVSWTAFHLGRDYFIGARDALNSKHLLTGASSVRAAIENISDMLYIFRDAKSTQKYAPTYVASGNAYKTAVKEAAAVDMLEVFASRTLKQANKWTSASIDDRLHVVGNFMATVYDMLSYFSHPNPAAIDFIGKPQLREAQIDLIHQGNCMTALFMMAIIINQGHISTVSLEELDATGREFGIEIVSSGT